MITQVREKHVLKEKARMWEYLAIEIVGFSFGSSKQKLVLQSIITIFALKARVCRHSWRFWNLEFAFESFVCKGSIIQSRASSSHGPIIWQLVIQLCSYARGYKVHTCFLRTCWSHAFFINTRREIVLQTDRKKKVTFFFLLQLLRPNQAVKLALGTVAL